MGFGLTVESLSPIFQESPVTSIPYRLILHDFDSILETEDIMSGRRAIQGIWLIERGSGRNLIAKAYTGIDIDMDLIAPFLSATHTFIDRASSEEWADH